MQSQARNLYDMDKPSILPEQFHISKSEKRLRDEVYWTMAELSGHGFSSGEMQIVIQVVGNTLFGTKWKLPRELEETVFHCSSISSLSEIYFKCKRCILLVQTKEVICKTMEMILTYYIYTLIPTWTYSQNSIAAAEAPSLRMSSDGSSLK